MVSPRRIKELERDGSLFEQDDEEEEENGPINYENIAEKECATWMLCYLAHRHTDEFAQVGQMQKLDWSNKRMDGPTAAAMWSESNVSIYQQRIMRRYLTATFGFSMIVPESIMYRLVTDDVPPDAKKFITNDGETIHFCMKPMKSIVKRVVDDLVANSDP